MAKEAWRRQYGETTTAFERFVFYLNLGPERSFEQVAERFGVSKRSVEGMAKRWRWKHRISAMVEQDAADWRDQIGERILKSRRAKILASDKLLEKLLRRIDDLDEKEIPAFQIARMLRDLTKVYESIIPPNDQPPERLRITVDWGSDDDDDSEKG